MRWISFDIPFIYANVDPLRCGCGLCWFIFKIEYPILFEVKNAIFCIFADFDIHYNVVNRELRFRSMTVNVDWMIKPLVQRLDHSVYCRWNSEFRIDSMKLKAYWIDGDIRNKLWCGLLVFVHGQDYYLQFGFNLFFLYKLYKKGVRPTWPLQYAN